MAPARAVVALVAAAASAGALQLGRRSPAPSLTAPPPRLATTVGAPAVVAPCGAPPSAGHQRFLLNASTGALTGADGVCLFRDPPGGTTAVAAACDGSPASSWRLAPCTATGCDPSSGQSWVVSSPDGHVLGVPGAVGPTLDVWTVDDPTGALHNELWAWNATDGTLRTLNTGGPPDVFGQCVTLPPLPPPPPPCTASPRVACHVGTWTAPPSRVPSTEVVDGPLLGNGDLGAVFAASPAGGGLAAWLGKSDAWATNTAVDQDEPALHSDTFYTAISGASLVVDPAGAAAPGGGGGGGWTTLQFAATQTLATSTVDVARVAAAAGVAGNVSVALGGAVIATDENALLATLTVSQAGGGGGAVLVNITLGTATAFALPLAAGLAPLGGGGGGAAAWAVKQGVRATDNPMLLMPCDSRTYVIHPSVNTFAVVDAATGRVAVANGSSTALCPRQVGPAKLSIGLCADASGAADWRLVPAAPAGAPPGALQLRSGANASACAWASGPAYHNSGGLVRIGACADQAGGWWEWAGGQVRANATQCLTAVPPNVNVTLAFAAAVLDASGAPAPVVGAATVPPTGGGGGGDDAAQQTLTVALEPGAAYTLVLTAVSSRDVQWGADPLGAALGSLGRYVGAPGVAYAAARREAHAAAWAAFWNASAVYLGEGRQLLEGAWYGFQHNLAATTAPGKLPPGLWGVWAVDDRNGWNGDYTLDYNAQANFYGSCSSNRCGQVAPYLELVGAEWHVELSRQRAAANWLAKGSAGGPGQTSQSMGCGYMDAPYEDPHVCPPSVGGGYAGLEMTTHIGPFPGLAYYADLSLRVVAAMSLKPFIDVAEYTLDVAWANATAWPLLAGAADFYASYAVPNATTGWADIPQACAQEICGGGPPAERNPHHDLSYARTTLAWLLEWAPRLGRAGDARLGGWAELLGRLPPLPTATVGNATVWAEAADTDAYWGSNAHAYSIVYTAALHPAEAVGLGSEPATLEVAWATVAATTAVNAWRPLNGLCMAWCPAVHVAGPDRAAGVLDGWEAALGATMHPNFYPDLGGGGIEQFGATEAVNGALLQSGGGLLRLFPMWPRGENASFTSLRARGAFTVSAAWDAGAGVRAPVTVVADGGVAGFARNCTFLNPWADVAPAAPTVVQVGGGPVVVAPAWPPTQPDAWAFEAQPGATYQLSPAGA